MLPENFAAEKRKCQCGASMASHEAGRCQPCQWLYMVAESAKETGKKPPAKKKKSWIDDAKEHRDRAIKELDYMDDWDKEES